MHLAEGLIEESSRRDLDRARELLEDARACEDAAAFDVEARLEGVVEQTTL